MRNMLSVELEEYFHDEVYSANASDDAAAPRTSRVVPQTQSLLDLLAERDTRATFFVLGSLAEREPRLVAEIAIRGHEVASHGFAHEPAEAQGERGFRRDVRRSKVVLEDILGRPVTGYRAPGFSIGERTPWAHRILAEEGFAYSSSVYPSRLDTDVPGFAPPTPWVADGGTRGIAEFPPLTRRLAGQNVPVAGGGYMRLLPVHIVSRAIRSMNAARAPAVVCLRPWEIDATQSDLPHAPLDQWRHWAGVDTFRDKLSELLREFEFGAIGEQVPDDCPRPRAATHSAN